MSKFEGTTSAGNLVILTPAGGDRDTPTLRTTVMGMLRSKITSQKIACGNLQRRGNRIMGSLRSRGITAAQTEHRMGENRGKSRTITKTEDGRNENGRVRTVI